MNAGIRQETGRDFAAVFEVNKQAFGRVDEAELVDLLRNNKTAFIPDLSLVAVLNRQIIGHILFTNITIRNDSGEHHESLALAPMAVFPDRQKKGIGSALVRSGLHRAAEPGYRSVTVLGHEHYYPKFGFVPAWKWNITCPCDVPAGLFMALELVTGGLTGVSGIVQYPSEFGMV